MSASVSTLPGAESLGKDRKKLNQLKAQVFSLGLQAEKKICQIT